MVISLLGLFLMGVDFVNGMAVGTSVTVAVVMLASITLLPALLGFAGRTIDRFSVRRHKAPKPTRADACGTGGAAWCSAARGPRPSAASRSCSLLAIPLLSMRLAFPDAGGNPKTDTTRQAYDLVAEGFGAGFNGPLVLAAEFPKGTDTAALDELVDAPASRRPTSPRWSAPTLEPVGRRRGHPA